MSHGGLLVITRVVDPHLFDADPDLTFYIKADPYPDPAPLQSDGYLDHCRPSRAPF
jgi:hypothetical protein